MSEPENATSEALSGVAHLAIDPTSDTRQPGAQQPTEPDDESDARQPPEEHDDEADAQPETNWDDMDDEECKKLCLEKWHSLESDAAAWDLLDRDVDVADAGRWRRVVPKVLGMSRWKIRLQKTDNLICNVVAHHVGGPSLEDAGLPDVMVVERRFNVQHLHTFVLPDAAVLYFEPEVEESDRAGFDDFIEYLHSRTRAGLALEGRRRFIFAPPCEYTRTQVHYQGGGLIGIVQNAFPPLGPD